MSPSATPATQSAAASPATDPVQARHQSQSAAASPVTNPVQARHQSQPNALSATPATRNEGGCDQAQRLPRKTEVDVTKRHACHAKCRGVTGD